MFKILRLLVFLQKYRCNKLDYNEIAISPDFCSFKEKTPNEQMFFYTQLAEHS